MVDINCRGSYSFRRSNMKTHLCKILEDRRIKRQNIDTVLISPVLLFLSKKTSVKSLTVMHGAFGTVEGSSFLFSYPTFQ